jgi:glyoxylase-like metal-dependent hydrolase (beta-lactamase superfamily II)
MHVITNNPCRLQIESFFDTPTCTYSHLLWDADTRQCALIDSVLDYDHKSGRTGTAGAEQLARRVSEHGLQVQWLLETHVHADHLSAAPWLQQRLGGTLAIGAQITAVQKTFGHLFNAGPGFATDGRPFGHLFQDGECFAIGGLQAEAWHTPGHTPACMTYVVRDAQSTPMHTVALVGDTLFMPDYGTARCDFPGGDAAQLYRSIQRVLSLPDDTPLYLCHDYPPNGRAPQCMSTVAAQKAHNIHVHAGVSEAEFVAMRRQRDATLAMPVLMLPSVQVNMRGGQLPPPEDNGIAYLKIPLNAV